MDVILSRYVSILLSLLSDLSSPKVFCIILGSHSLLFLMSLILTWIELFGCIPVHRYRTLIFHITGEPTTGEYIFNFLPSFGFSIVHYHY